MSEAITSFSNPVTRFSTSGTPGTTTVVTMPSGTRVALIKSVTNTIRVSYSGATDAGAQGSEYVTLYADQFQPLPIMDDTDPSIGIDSDSATVAVEIIALPEPLAHLANAWAQNLRNAASGVTLADTAAYYTGENVEAALDELGDYRVYEATKTITAAELRALNATPITVIAAPGAGKYIDVIECHWFLDYGGVQMDAAAAGDTLVLKYTNGSGAAITDAIAGDTIGGATADYHTTALRVPELVPVTNALVCAHINSGEWYAAAGTSELKVSVLYRIRTQPT